MSSEPDDDQHFDFSHQDHRLDESGWNSGVGAGYPFKILYVSKTLNGDYTFPTANQCGSTPSGKAANHDLVQIRIATSTDGIHWTDQGVVTGLNDPTTISYSGVRYAAPNGTLLKLSTGNWDSSSGAATASTGIPTPFTRSCMRSRPISQAGP